MQSEAERQHESAEFERYRAVKAKRQKWETREARMIQQQERLEAARSAQLRDESEVERSPLDKHHEGGGSREDEGGLDRHGVIASDPTFLLAVYRVRMPITAEMGAPPCPRPLLETRPHLQPRMQDSSHALHGRKALQLQYCLLQLFWHNSYPHYRGLPVSCRG